MDLLLLHVSINTCFLFNEVNRTKNRLGFFGVFFLVESPPLSIISYFIFFCENRTLCTAKAGESVRTNKVMFSLSPYFGYNNANDL